MKMSSVTDQLAEYYKKLFTLGSLRRNLYIFTGLYSALILYLYVILNISVAYGGSFTSPIITLLIIPGLSLLLDYVFMRNNDRDKRLYSLRRLLALNNIITLITLSSAIIFTPLMVSNIDSLPMVHLTIGTVIGFKLVILYSTAYSRLPYLVGNLASLYFIYIATYLILYLYPSYDLTSIDPNSMILSIYLISSLLILSVGYITYISRVSKKVTGVSVFSYLKGFIDSWVLNDPNYLEKLISPKSITVKSEADYIVVPDLPMFPLLMVVPYFHFGPFRNVGSSDYPAILSRYFFNKEGLETMVFHSPSTHTLDIPNKDEVAKTIKFIDDFSSPYIANTLSNIMSLRGDKVATHLVKADGVAFIFLEAEEMEDVPPRVVREIRSEARELGYRHVVVIDSHNALTRIRYRLSEDQVNSMVALAKKILREGLTLETYPFKAGFVKINLPGIDIESGLGSSGVSIFAWETLTSKNVIINFDSNNLSPVLRGIIYKVVRDEFGANVIVTTNDTHEVSAVPLNIRGYNILGERRDEANLIIHYIRIGLRKCFENMKESDLLIYNKEFTVSVLGMDALERLNEVLRVSYSAAKNMLFKLALPLMFINIFLVYLTMLI